MPKERNASSSRPLSHLCVSVWGGGNGPGQGEGGAAVVPTGTLALAAHGVLFDELVSRTAVQAQLQATAVLREVQGVLGHADGEGQVAAHPPDDDGGADVTGLDPHLPTHTGAASLRDAQTAALAATSSPVLEGQRQVVCGGLVHLLIRAAEVRLEDDCDLKQEVKPALMFDVVNYGELQNNVPLGC
uniref:Uncharacterized protein n=1 Tax=Oryzias latipes TaxID=8090 RepID=A0A3P9IKW5_ORYLA